MGPAQPPIQWVLWGWFFWGKAAGYEADLSPLSSAEVKNDGAIPPLPHTSSRRRALIN
jgi:hypothetical protein